MVTAVTIVANDVDGGGGMERQLRALITGLLERGTTVTIVSRTLGLPAHERLRWRRVPGPARPFVLAYPWFALAASLMLLRERDAVTHTTGAIVLNPADVCTVHYLHNGPGGRVDRSSRGTFVYRLNGRVSRVVSRVCEWFVYRSSARSGTLVAVSNALAREIAEAFPSRADDVRVIGNGVDVERFRPDPASRKEVREELRLSEDDYAAVFVGSEWRAKGLGVVIDALATCSRCHLIVVGKGDNENARRHAEAIGAVDRIRFVGESVVPERYLAAADVFVLPSAYETFSMATYEAAASGLPVIATAVGAVPDLVTRGAGILVQREAKSVAAALQRLADAPAIRAQMGLEGRRAAAERGWESVVDGYLSLYELGRRPVPILEPVRL